MTPGPVATYRGRELRPTAGLADRLRIESAICSHERVLPPSAEPSIEGVSQVLRRIVTPEAFSHFERIVRVANVELEKLLVFRTQNLLDPVGASTLTLQEDDAKRDAEEEDRRTEVLKEFGVATKQTRKSTAHDWAIEESHNLKHYLTGVLGRIILDFTKYAETVLRWRRDDADDRLGEGEGGLVKLTQTEHDDLMKKLEHHDFAYSTLESKCNALAVELRDNRRAFLREKLVWKEQLRKIMAHLPEQEQARVMRKGLHQSVEFYDESNNLADAEAVRDEYEMLILQIKEEQNTRAEMLKSEIDLLQRKLEEQEEAKRALMMRRPVSALSNGTSGTRETSEREETLARQNAMLQEELRRLHLKEKMLEGEINELRDERESTRDRSTPPPSRSSSKAPKKPKPVLRKQRLHPLTVNIKPVDDMQEAGAKKRILELEKQLSEAKSNMESLQSTIDAQEAAFGHMPHAGSQDEQAAEGMAEGVSGIAPASFNASLISMGTTATLPGLNSRPGSAKLVASRKGTDFMVPEATQTDDSFQSYLQATGGTTTFATLAENATDIRTDLRTDLEAVNLELRDEIQRLQAQIKELSMRNSRGQLTATTTVQTTAHFRERFGQPAPLLRWRVGVQVVVAALRWRRVQQAAALQRKKEPGPPATMAIIEMQLPMHGSSAGPAASSGGTKKDSSLPDARPGSRSGGNASSTSRGLLPGLPKGLAARRRSLAAAATEGSTAKDASQSASSSAQSQARTRPCPPSPSRADVDRAGSPCTVLVDQHPSTSSCAVPAEQTTARVRQVASPPTTAATPAPPTTAAPVAPPPPPPLAAAAPIFSTGRPAGAPILSTESPKAVAEALTTEKPIAQATAGHEDFMPDGIVGVPSKHSAVKGHMRKGRLQEIELGQHVASTGGDVPRHALDVPANHLVELGDVSAVTWATEPLEFVEPAFAGRMLLPRNPPKFNKVEGNANAVWQNPEGHPLDFISSSMSPFDLKAAANNQYEPHGPAHSPRPAAASRMPLLQRTIPRSEPAAGESDRDAHVAVKFQVGGGFSVKGGSKPEGSPLDWRWPAQSNTVSVKATVPLQSVPDAEAKRPNSSSAATRPNKPPQKGLPRPSTTPGGVDRRLKKAASDTQVQAGCGDRRTMPDGSGGGGRHRALIPAT